MAVARQLFENAGWAVLVQVQRRRLLVERLDLFECLISLFQYSASLTFLILKPLPWKSFRTGAYRRASE